MAATHRTSWATIVGTAAVVVLCAVAIVIVEAPANWLARYLADRTNGIVLLADAQGTVWSGSAVMALASLAATAPSPADPAAAPGLALPGRVTWTLDFERVLAPVLHLKHDGVLLQPVAARVRDGGLTIDPGTVTLPASMLRLLGAPLNTLMPDGRCELHWNALRFEGQGALVGDGTLRIGSFALALSPVRPLGDYRVTWSSGAQGLTWQLATENGPLDLQGAGSLVGRRNQARVVVRIANNAPAPVAAQLGPLLDVIGRRTPDEAIIETGNRN